LGMDGMPNSANFACKIGASHRESDTPSKITISWINGVVRFSQRTKRRFHV
jgi:hypothetical protein